MDKLELQMKRLKKLQKKGKKQATRINRLARKQLKDVELPERVTQLTPKSIDLKKGNWERMKGNAKKVRNVFFFLAIIAALVFAVNAAFRQYKRKKQNLDDESRFDFIEGITESIDDTFDFDKASLEELEDALLKVEKELKDVSEAIDEKA